MNKLFEEKIENYDLLQLENWIRRCRTAIKKENYLNSNRPLEDYKEAVLDFVEEWKEHYRNNEDIYNSETYKKAILASGLKKYNFIFKYKDKVRILNNDNFYNKLLKKHNQDDNILMQNFTQTRLNSTFDYYSFFDKKLLELDRNNYRKIISEQIENKFNNYNFIIEVDDESILTKDVDDLINLLKDTKVNIHFEIKSDSSNKMGLLEELYNFDIAKQQYYDYRNMNVIKNFEKKLILNIGLALSLDYENYEKLLIIHGFSIENSKEIRDILLKEMIFTGLGKEYIDIVLEDKNIRNIKKRSGLLDKRDNCYNIYYDYNKRIQRGEITTDKMEAQYIRACKKMIETIDNFFQSLDKKERRYQEIISKKQKFLDEVPDRLSELDDKRNDFIKKISEAENNIKIHHKEFDNNWLHKKSLGTLSDSESKMFDSYNEKSEKLNEKLKELELEVKKNETKKNNLEAKMDYEVKIIEKYKNKMFELKYIESREKHSPPKQRNYDIFQYSKISNGLDGGTEEYDRPCDKFSATREELETLKNELEKYTKSKEA